MNPETTAVHNAADLNQLFTRGTGPYDDTTMKGKLFPYPLPRNGQFGAPLYNGCYDRKGRRIGNLDSNLTCAAVMSSNPRIAIFRLFLGYKISCSGGVASGTCSSAQLLMNCEYKQVQVGEGTLESTPAATRYCSNESGILRNAQGVSNNDNAMGGCSPGEDGSGYDAHPNQPCPKCSPGTFNANFNPNKTACTACPMPTPLPTGVLSIGGWDTPVGATSADTCRPNGITCVNPGFHLSLDQRSCEPDAPACNLTLNVTPKNPSATASPNPPSTDGSISANVSGNSGTVAVSITNPSAMSPSGAGLPAVFNGLSANTYTVKATDSNCSTSTQVTLTEAASTPSCSTCPAGSTLSGTNCVTAPTTSASYTQYGYTCQGAGGCTSQPCHPTCTQGQTFGQVSASDSTARTCDGNSLYTTFGGSCSMQSGPTTIPSSQSCPSGFSLVSGSCTMACTPNPTPTGCPYSPPMLMSATGTPTGNITANLSNNVGTLTMIHWTMPSSGTCSVSGSKGESLACTGVMAGSYTITAVDPANTACTASATVSAGTAPSCDPYANPATSGAPLECRYQCTGPAEPHALKTITTGTCGGKYLDSGVSRFCTGDRTTNPECANEVWAENQLKCTTPVGSGGVGAGPAASTSCGPASAPSPTPMLVFNVHAASDCTAAGGTVYTDSSMGAPLSFCRFSMETADPCTYDFPRTYPDGSSGNAMSPNGASCNRYFIQAWTECPTGWTKYKGWSAWTLAKKYNTSNFMTVDYGSCLASNGKAQTRCQAGYFSENPSNCLFPFEGQTLPFADYSNSATCTGYWHCDSSRPWPASSQTFQYKWENVQQNQPASTPSCPAGWNLASSSSPGDPFYPAYSWYCYRSVCQNTNPDYTSMQMGQWHVPVSTEVGCY